MEPPVFCAPLLQDSVATLSGRPESVASLYSENLCPLHAPEYGKRVRQLPPLIVGRASPQGSAGGSNLGEEGLGAFEAAHQVRGFRRKDVDHFFQNAALANEAF